jgi:hypothetical protein
VALDVQVQPPAERREDGFDWVDLGGNLASAREIFIKVGAAGAR